MPDSAFEPGAEILDECREVFRALVRTDTTNPPGAERAAADILAGIFARRGIAYRIVEAEPGRANIVARIPGGRKPPLVLLSHLDVVAADARQWTRPPFSADEFEGSIWGRGTLDTKQLTAMELAAFLHLADSGIKPDRDVVFAASADEEAGSRLGMELLARDELRFGPGAIAVSEGGGFPIELGGRWFMLCTAGEKGMCRVRLSARGAGGIPAIAEALERMLRHESPPDLRGIPLGFAARLGPDSDGGNGLLQYQLQDSVMVNRVRCGNPDAGAKPESLEVELEFRVSPSATEASMKALLGSIIGNLPVSWEIQAFEPGFECDPESPLPGLLAENCRRFGLDAVLLPMLALGRTDGRFLGWQGASVYGFSPVLQRDEFRGVLARVHGVDERIGVDSFDFGCRVLTRTIMELCAPQGV